MDDPQHQKRVALEALRDVAEGTDPAALVLAGFDAAVAGVARTDVEALVASSADEPRPAARSDGFTSRSSAPPPDEVAGLRHELGNAMTAIAALAARAEGQATASAAFQALARIRRLADATGAGSSAAGTGVHVGSREVSRDIVEMVDDLAPFADQQRVAVEPRVEPGLMSVVPVASLRLIVWNLLKNAIEASPKGSLVTVTAQYRSGDLRVAVEDRGGGLPAALRERVFEAHFSTKDEGRGLGLSLVQAEVERLGGRIELSTPRRGGTCFAVSLPGAQLSPVELTAEDRAVSGVVRKQPLVGFHVALVCELVFLERALAAVGATVSRVTAGQLMSSDESYDVLVVDTADVSVAEAAALRLTGRARRVIALVADDEPCVAEGVDAALPRSFDLGQLAATIEGLVPTDGAANGS